jgi:hypothetical protein
MQTKAYLYLKVQNINYLVADLWKMCIIIMLKRGYWLIKELSKLFLNRRNVLDTDTFVYQHDVTLTIIESNIHCVHSKQIIRKTDKVFIYNYFFNLYERLISKNGWRKERKWSVFKIFGWPLSIQILCMLACTLSCLNFYNTFPK